VQDILRFILKDTTSSKKKEKYLIRNWKQYNQSLVNRASITFWFDEDSIAKWYSVERTGKPGRPDTYSDNAIRCGLMIKAVFRTALRALQGFVGSLIKCLGLDIVYPHYSVQKKHPLPALLERDQAIRKIQELGDEGRALWKREIGYHRRSRVETFMFRYKAILGDRLAARKRWTQATEVAIKLDVLNRMTELGMPKSHRMVS